MDKLYNVAPRPSPERRLAVNEAANLQALRYRAPDAPRSSTFRTGVHVSPNARVERPAGGAEGARTASMVAIAGRAPARTAPRSARTRS